MTEEKVPKISFQSGDEIKQEEIKEESKTDDSVPTELVPLPSLGKIYPRTSPLYKQTHIELRNMTGIEEDILTTRSLLRNGKAIDMVLQNCIIDKSVVLDDLITGDKNSIMIHLRVGSYGPAYVINIVCPKCGESTPEHEFDLGALEMNVLEVDPISPDENLFEFVLPASKKTVYFKLLTSGEESNISETQEKIRKRVKVQIENNVTTILNEQIVSLDGNEDKKYIQEFVRKIQARDSRALRKYISDITPDVIMKQNFSCPECGTDSIVNVPITTEFFWPET